MKHKGKNIEYGILNIESKIQDSASLVFPPIQHSTFNIQSSAHRGFTILEIIIVISILGVLLSIILPSLTNFRQRSILNTETQEILTLINKARLSSMSSKDDQQHGIHFEAGKIALFEGTIYTAGAETNEEHSFDTVLTLAPITINGGGAETIFQKITGSTNQNSTTTLKVVANNSASTTIIILPSGIATIF